MKHGYEVPVTVHETTPWVQPIKERLQIAAQPQQPTNQSSVLSVWQARSSGLVAEEWVPATRECGQEAGSNHQTSHDYLTKEESTIRPGEDPRAYHLYLRREMSNTFKFRAKDRHVCSSSGKRYSQPRWAHMQIRGVSAWGIVDSGADITNMGKCLLQLGNWRSGIARSQIWFPTHDRKPFVLHGMLGLQVSFAEKMMNMTVYVKMDACDKLLLSDGVWGSCSNIRRAGRATVQQLAEDMLH